MSKFSCFIAAIATFVVYSADARTWKLEGRLSKEGSQFLLIVNPELRIMKFFKLKAGSTQILADTALLTSGTLIRGCFDGKQAPELLTSFDVLNPADAPVAFENIDAAVVNECVL